MSASITTSLKAVGVAVIVGVHDLRVSVLSGCLKQLIYLGLLFWCWYRLDHVLHFIRVLVDRHSMQALTISPEPLSADAFELGT